MQENIVVSALTALFVPGSRPDRFAKATASTADLVILDLEDAVAPEGKDEARSHVVGALDADSPKGLQAIVRINASSPWREADLKALSTVAGKEGHGLLGVMVPKAEAVSGISEVRSLFPADVAVVPLIESALGVVNALHLAQVPGVSRLSFGAVDLRLDIDAGEDPRALNYARSTVVFSSRAAGLAPPLDTPSTAIDDLDQVVRDSELGRTFGFGGKLCIHPRQLSAVREAYVPADREIQWATRVLEAEGSGAAQIAGEMIDRPVIERARRVLARTGSHIPGL